MKFSVKKEFKDRLKIYKKDQKEKEKRKEPNKNVFVIDFEGDIKASGVSHLRDEISTILSLSDNCSEVVLRLESPGGMVHSYGLAASQLLRLKENNIPLTVCVDKVAASGGYMMACVADKIISAPFAIVGSIGVLAQVPNFHRLLKKNDVDYQEITAGEYKRTISIFGEITEKGKQKFTDDIARTHELFKNWVSQRRPKVKITEVATGEHWYGQEVLEKGLVDEIKTSDQYIMELIPHFQVFTLKVSGKRSFQEKLQESFGQIVENRLPEWVLAWQNKRWY
ncbi:MAG: protease SohB [Bdellovibrionales bacterium]